MLNIIICEDDTTQLEHYANLVTEIVSSENIAARLGYKTTQPTDLINYLGLVKQTEAHLFILDIHLNHKIDGLQLAAEIRKKVKQAEIVFLTTDAEKMPLVFQHRLKALDYIIKNQPDLLKQRFTQVITDCLATKQKDKFVLDYRGEFMSFPYEEVMMIATTSTPGKLRIYTANESHHFYSTIKNVHETHPELLLVHKSFLVNPENIKSYDKKERRLTMNNGSVCDVSFSKRATMNELMKKKHLWAQ